MREQIKMLKAHPNLRADLINVLQIRRQFSSVDNDLAFLVFFQRIDAANQGGFPRSRRPTNHDSFASVDG